MTDELTRCSLCEFGLHDECLLPKSDTMCCCSMVDWSLPFAEPAKAKRTGGEPKALEDMADPVSTGRKRAVQIAPIFNGMVCEWAYLKFAGGGAIPIIGCEGNLLSANTKDGDGGDLHHGPDKNTLNNTPGVNLHRICKSCHHLWHKKNDPFYIEPRPAGDVQWLPDTALVKATFGEDFEWLPHDGLTRATPDELAEANSTRTSINRKEGEDLPPVVGLL